MAVGHAAGLAALMLGAEPFAAPSDVKRHLLNAATRDVVVGDMLKNTPNKMLTFRKVT